MVSQQTKTLVVTLIAIYLGYWYYSTSSTKDSTATPTIYYTGKVPHVSLEQLDSIRYTQNMDKKLKAFILGATGAVGKELVKVLAEDARFEKVTLIGRRPVQLTPPEENPGYKKFENQIIDFDKLDQSKDVFKGYDVGFSTLGTTRRKSGAEGFYRVDHDYVVQTAKLAKEGGCNHLHLVSSAGANKNAYFLYPKTKGEVEEELTNMDFPKLSIYRPGFLIVPGGREEHRTVEAILQGVFKPMDRMRWFSVETPVLAKVMVANCFRETPSKFEIVDNGAINKFGKELAAGNTPPPPPSSSSGQGEGQGQQNHVDPLPPPST